jgi:hypothetical protein
LNLKLLKKINIFIDRSNIFRLCRSANGVRDRVEMALFVSDIFVILIRLGEPNMLYTDDIGRDYLNRTVFGKCLIWFKHNAESDEIRRQLLASSIV